MAGGPGRVVCEPVRCAPPSPNHHAHTTRWPPDSARRPHAVHPHEPRPTSGQAHIMTLASGGRGPAS